MPKEEQVVRDTAFRVLAPALNSFVLWALKEAVERGIKRLYFLARDGYFFYRTAQQYVKHYHLPVECRYLYVSRYSLRVPMYHRNMEEALNLITLGGLDVTLEKVFHRAALTEAQAEVITEEILREFTVIPDCHTQIPRNELGGLREVLKRSETFLHMVRENSRAAYPLIEHYLRQEGLSETTPMALVDSGWMGSMQKTLQELRYALGAGNKLCGFYFGLYEVPGGAEREAYHTYYFSPEGQMRRKVHFSNCLFEGLFSAPHGMTLGYLQGEVFAEPVLGEIAEERKKLLVELSGYLEAYQTALLKERLVKARPAAREDFFKLAEDMTDKSVRRMVEKQLSRLMSRPTCEEARIFGRMSFTDDVLEYGGNQMAAALTEEELFENHLWRRIKGQISARYEAFAPLRQSAWYEGSVMAYGNRKYHRRHLVSYARYKYMLYYVKRVKWRRNHEG